MILDDCGGRMAPKRGAKKQMSDDGEDYDDDDYRKKRDRNNQAVKRSRFKSKQKTAETQDRINKLKDENTELENKVKKLTAEKNLLKELFVTHGASTLNLKDVNLQEILAEDPEDSS